MKKYFSFILFIILVAYIGKALSQIKQWKGEDLFTGNGIQLKLENNHLLVFSNKRELTEIKSFQFNFTNPKSLSLIKKSDNEVYLKAVYPGDAKYNEAPGNLIDIIKITRSGGCLRFYSSPQWASNVTVSLKDLDEHYFGINENLYPDNHKSPDLRGKVLDVEILGNANQYHENYADVWSSFYMSSRGYASFFDTFAYGRYQLGVNGVTELYHRTGKLDWYLFVGKNGDDILKSYYSVIGHPKYIPIWACGPIVWRDEYKGKDQILDDMQKMTDLKIPLTGLMVDRPYSDGADEWSKMNFNKRFSNPKEWISELNNKYGIQFMTWVGSLTFSDKDFPGLLPNYKGYIDLTNPKALGGFENRMKTNQYSVNVRGHKMDRGDEDFPVTSAWYDKTPESERRNKYIYLYSKNINKFLQDSFGKDEFNYARAAYQRCQPDLSAVWGGDSRSTWDGLACSIANSVRVGYMGFPDWGSDVGGYFGGRISESLYARWLEFGTWSGMFETKLDNAGGKGEDRPPWKYSKNLQDVFRNVCEQRMEMLPYIYSAANSSYKNGVLMKPLSYEYPQDANTYGIWNEYLFGNAFLVAPICDSTNTRDVYLPNGRWYDYNDISKSIEGRKTIKVNLPFDKIPVFVKANSIYVTGRIFYGSDKLWNNNKVENPVLTFHIFPGNEGETYIYNYIDYNDKDTAKNIIMESGKNKIIIKVDPLKEKSKLLVRVEKKPLKVILNGKSSNFNWLKDMKLIEVNLGLDVRANFEIDE